MLKNPASNTVKRPFISQLVTPAYILPRQYNKVLLRRYCTNTNLYCPLKCLITPKSNITLKPFFIIYNYKHLWPDLKHQWSDGVLRKCEGCKFELGSLTSTQPMRFPSCDPYRNDAHSKKNSSSTAQL